MYDIIGRVKENVLPDAGTSEQDPARNFCNFFVDKITNIWDRLRNNSRFVLEKEREAGMLEFNQVSESYVQKIIGKSKARNCTTDPIPSKLIKKYKMYFTLIITTLMNLPLKSGNFAKDWKLSTVMPLIKKPNLSKDWITNQLKICALYQHTWKGNVGTAKCIYDNSKFTTRLYLGLQKKLHWKCTGENSPWQPLRSRKGYYKQD